MPLNPLAAASHPSTEAGRTATAAITKRFSPAIQTALRDCLAGGDGGLYDLMRYHLGWIDEHGRPSEAVGGKLLRPVLCLLSSEAAGGDVRAAMPAAAAIELLHNFTLIHDDIEDGSETRHGRPALWRLRGVPLALNAGDGMFALARNAMLPLQDHGHSPGTVLQAIRILDEATTRLCEGQHLDLAGEVSSREVYLTMIGGKSAALPAAACAIGALLAGAEDATISGLHEFGRRLGLAFQIFDDVLGIWGNEAAMGKPPEDLQNGKRSFPLMVALEQASRPQRAVLDRVLHASGRSADDVAASRNLLDELGTRAEAEAAARQNAEAAVASLEALALAHNPRDELIQLARFAADRAA
jgi:geranylgeranyl diphosphate synthase type I